MWHVAASTVQLTEYIWHEGIIKVTQR
jgi:hypothetical protein